MSASLRDGIDELTVRRRVIAAIAAAAARAVPGVERVGRGGPRALAWLAGRPVSARLIEDRVHVRLWLVAQQGEPLAELSARARTTIGRAIEQQLGLRLGDVTVLVDGVGG
jgi:uncharacterized alkaline shock family protein YloU